MKKCIKVKAKFLKTWFVSSILSPHFHVKVKKGGWAAPVGFSGKPDWKIKCQNRLCGIPPFQWLINHDWPGQTPGSSLLAPELASASPPLSLLSSADPPLFSPLASASPPLFSLLVPELASASLPPFLFVPEPASASLVVILLVFSFSHLLSQHYNTALASEEGGPVGDGKSWKGEAGGDLPLWGENWKSQSSMSLSSNMAILENDIMIS